jgi:glutamate dehydrogenase
MGYYWKEQEVNGKLEEKMVNAFQNVFQMSEEKRQTYAALPIW